MIGLPPARVTNHSSVRLEVVVKASRGEEMSEVQVTWMFGNMVVEGSGGRYDVSNTTLNESMLLSVLNINGITDVDTDTNITALASLSNVMDVITSRTKLIRLRKFL